MHTEFLFTFWLPFDTLHKKLLPVHVHVPALANLQAVIITEAVCTVVNLMMNEALCSVVNLMITEAVCTVVSQVRTV